MVARERRFGQSGALLNDLREEVVEFVDSLVDVPHLLQVIAAAQSLPGHLQGSLSGAPLSVGGFGLPGARSRGPVRWRRSRPSLGRAVAARPDAE